jgi:hypothetical protein
MHLSKCVQRAHVRECKQGFITSPTLARANNSKSYINARVFDIDAVRARARILD